MYVDHLLKALEMMISMRRNLVLECKLCRYAFHFAACDGLGTVYKYYSPGVLWKIICKKLPVWEQFCIALFWDNSFIN